MAVSRELDDRIEIVAGQIKAVQNGMNPPRPIYIAFDEWNVWYRARGTGEFNIAKTGLEEIYNYEDALVMGAFFNSFIRHADVVKMANLAQLVNVIAPIFTNKQGMYLQTIFFPIAEYARQKGNIAIDALVKSPEYQPAGGGRPVGYLDVSSTFDSKTRTVFLNVLNRNQKTDTATRIDNVEGRIAGTMDVWELNHPDLKATHTFGADKKIRPVTKTANVPANGNGFVYTFPKQSLTILKIKLNQ
jgi:alpha-N-arabinofuranosidase